MIELQSLIGYQFKQGELLEHALTHPSFYSNQKEKLPINHFERLEFVGDRVLGLIVGDMLYQQFNQAKEGELARRLAWLVCRETLSKVATHMSIPSVLKYSRATEANTTQWMTFLSDACEALIGAIYYDGGLEEANKLIRKFWKPMLNEQGAAAKDYKTQLQEFAQSTFKTLPTYKIIQQTGPSHNPEITVECTVKKTQVSAKGSSKKMAENDCAQRMLAKLKTV
jgi:ribonuclease-3